MTEHEQMCFNTLMTIIDSRYLLFPQVHLEAILGFGNPNGNRKFAMRHINQKSVDFVLCDRQTFHPVLAIELNDSTHDRPWRIRRDIEVQRILAQAGLPLLVLEYDDAHDVVSLRNKLHQSLSDIT